MHLPSAPRSVPVRQAPPCRSRPVLNVIGKDLKQPITSFTTPASEAILRHSKDPRSVERHRREETPQMQGLLVYVFMERKTRFELATLTLAR